MRIAIAGATGLVGRPLTTAARAAGHDVVTLSRHDGVDLTRADGLAEHLAGVDTVIDVTNAPVVDREGATEFFTTVAENLGRAATAAGVARTVVLSIIGVDRTPDDGYFVAKLAQEQAFRAGAPGVRVLRAAQFHEFAEQSLGWGRDGDHARIQDSPIQPVALAEVVRVLIDLATGVLDGDLVELAGPRPEQLVALVEALLARRGEAVTVIPAPVSDAVRAGALRPGPDALLAGPAFADWLG